MKISIFPTIYAYRGNGNFTAMCCFDSDGALCAYQDYGEYGVVKQKKKEELTTPLPKSRLHL